MRSASGGFTLLELMVVLALLVILSGVALPEVMHKRLKFQVSEALDPLQRIGEAARRRRLEWGSWLPNADMYRQGGNDNGVSYEPYDETYLKQWLGVELAKWGRFCFVLRQSPDAGINGEPLGADEVEIWALLRAASAPVPMYKYDLSCQVTADKESAGEIFPGNGDVPGGEGRVVVWHYPAPVTAENRQRMGRSDITLVWWGELSITDATQ
ncbi:MAG: type II secretion system protein [Magnetococcales bacterium]|nr:type II secretion system protein [Magnetococcales bacterium]